MNLQSTKKIKKAETQYTALYCRLSCDDDLQGDSNSIKNQKQMLTTYAEEQHFRNLRYYVDDGYSGSNFDRPDFKRMIEDVENGEISTVIVKDMSRFGRDHIMVGYYTKYLFPDADVRFIAVYDQVDSEVNADDDITPFKNILNEMYAKDCSRKIKAVMKAKGNSGKHLTSIPPFGYMKDPNDKEKWIVNEEAAAIVREAFNLCMQGYGPTQIARIFTERGYDTPAIFNRKHGLPTNLPIREGQDLWAQKTISDMLANMSYLGHTVNFKSYKKSYKSKKRYWNSKEDWAIFENTQEAIIDQATFDTVQKIREGRRRPTDMGEMSPLSGMLYCADCGKKMYLCRCTTIKQAEYFNCSSYRKQKKKTCTSHQITVKAVTEMILDDLRFTVNYAKEYKQQFYEMVEKTADTATKKELSSHLKDIDEAEKRIKALDKIIQSLYEDKVEEKISEERYLKLSELYENEQKELTDRVKTHKAEVERARAKKNEIQKFMALVNKYSDFEELTPDILRAFIDKVYIHELTKIDGHYHHTIEIVYNFIGATEPSWFAENEEIIYQTEFSQDES
ncbi:MAG: recombinase family protein [Clostridia bacterium]|nr:recombinase family protein [Clostridia bacterium]